MKLFAFLRAMAMVVTIAALLTVAALPNRTVEAQSGRQPEKKKVEKKVDEQKNNPSDPASQEPVPPMPKAKKDDQVIKIGTQVVGVDVTVIDKKTGHIYDKLAQKNFTVYEDGVKQEITNFRAGEGPMTAVLMLENNRGNQYIRGSYFDPTFAEEIFQAAATFVDSFVKKGDQIAIVTFAMKPKVITDFTDDRNVLHQAVVAGYHDMLNFRETNLWDALSFTLLGGKAIQLFNEENGPAEYTGLTEVEGHTAVILITLGMDTFSRITYDKALKIVEHAGVPIYSVHTGHFFDKKYDLGAEWRLNFQQAQNALTTFARYTGGAYFPMTFQTELPAIMQNISAMLRTQYDIGYSPTNTRREGKERKIRVDVDVDGDGVPDNKNLDLKFRERYVEADDRPAKK